MLAVALFMLLCLAPVPAWAAPLPGPGFLATGLADDNVFVNPSASVRSMWFQRAQQVNSHWVRIGVSWSLIAPATPPAGFRASDPSDPAYQWAVLDDAVRSAAAYHRKVLLTFAHPPGWAQGPNPPPNGYPDSWRIRAGLLGSFARAVAMRYSGKFPDPLQAGVTLPRVRYFQAWNEPNLPTSITPQWVRTRRGRFVASSPGIYRRMLNAVYRNVKAVQPHAYVLSAGTAPYGDQPGGGRVPPLLFTRDLLCISRSLRRTHCPVKPYFDGLDHHPYALTPTLPARNPDDISVPDMWKLQRVLAAAARWHTEVPRGRKDLWMTEINWTSNPPDPNGIPLTLQARYLALSFYEVWRQGISHAFWFLIRDAPHKSLTGAGLYYGDGTAKPAAAAFRFPFVAVRRADGRFRLWGRAPISGRVTIERLNRGIWRTLLRTRTTAGGVFYAVRRLRRGQLVRARVGAFTSVPWTN